MSSKATVLVADDHPIVAEALFTSLKRWFQVVAMVNSLDMLERAIETHSPRIVLLDLSFGKESSLPRLSGLVLKFPATRFVILTAHPDPVLADAAMLAGAMGFVLKQSAATELRIAIEEALAGRKYVTPKVQIGAGGASADRISEDRADFSERQREVLALLRQGHTNRVVADKLGISEKTVEYFIASMTRRVGVRGKAQLIRWSEWLFPPEGRS